MKITESKLRSIIRQVIKENDMVDFERMRDADPKRQNEELFNDLSQFMDLPSKFYPVHLHYIIKHVMSPSELDDYRKMVDSYQSPRMKEALQRVEDEIARGAGGEVTSHSAGGYTTTQYRD